MKLTIPQPTEIEAVAIRCQVAVRYGEEDIPNDFPRRKGDVWDVTVDIDTGRIRDWPKGFPACEVNMKVCDEGGYTLLGPDDVFLANIEDYVPECLPGRYGDYIEFAIDGRGFVTNWKRFCTAQNVKESFFKKEQE